MSSTIEGTQKQQPSAKAAAVLKSRLIGRTLRVVTRNGRIFQGKLMSIDFKSNLILHETVAQIPPTQNSPLNYELESCYDIKLKFIPPAGYSPEEQERLRQEYFGMHYYFGSVMISGEDILKVQLSMRSDDKDCK